MKRRMRARGLLPSILGLLALASAPAGASEREALQRVATTYYDAPFLERAQTYRRFRLGVTLVESAVVLAGAVWILVGPAGALGVRALEAVGGKPWLARALLLSVLHLGFALVRLPFSLVLFHHARSYGQRHDSWESFLVDWLKAVGVGWVVVLVAGLLVLGLFARFPRTWWVWATAGTGLLTTAYVLIAPLVIDPLFNRFTRMEDAVLEARLLDLARKGGIAADRVLVADASRRTHAANAYVTGVAGTRRIVVYDTLLEAFPPDEVASVLAHEVGHWRRHHIRTGILLGTGAALLGFLIAGGILGSGIARHPWSLVSRGDPGLVFPAYGLFLLLATLALVPSNWVSRRMESQADREALVLTADPEAFIRSETRLAQENLSEVLPPAWVEFVFYTHPSNARRILLAESYR